MGVLRKKKRVEFWRTEVVKIPVRVKFKTFDGERVDFIATKAVARRRKVKFYGRR